MKCEAGIRATFLSHVRELISACLQHSWPHSHTFLGQRSSRENLCRGDRSPELIISSRKSSLCKVLLSPGNLLIHSVESSQCWLLQCSEQWQWFLPTFQCCRIFCMITGIIHAHLQLLILKWLWDFPLIHHISSPFGWPCLSDNCFFFQQFSWHLLSAAQKAELRKRGLCGIHPHLDGKGGCVMDKGDTWVSITGSSLANSKKQLCLLIPCIPVCHYLQQSLWDRGILVPSELALVCVIKASLLFAATHHVTGCTSLAVMPHWALSLFGYSNCPVTFFSQGFFSPLIPHLNFFFLSFRPLLPGLQFSETVNNFLNFCCSFDIRQWSCSP